MKKRLNIIIGLALALSMNVTCFAAESANSVQVSGSSSVSSITGKQTLRLNDVLGYIDKNNIKIKSADQKILLYQRQYDRDSMNAALIKDSDTSEVNYPKGQYVNIKLQTDVIPKSDEQSIKDAKYDRNDLLQTTKFQVEQKYMNALNCQDQINTINAQIENVDKQIEQIKIKIEQGVATNDALQSLNVQKSQLQASLNTPEAQYQEDLLGIKQAIDMDLDSDLVLVPTNKEYARFDDSSIQGKIDSSVSNSYVMGKMKNNLAILQIKEDIYKKYSYNDATGEVSTGLSIQDLENSISDTVLNSKIGLWNSYYNLKNLEDNISVENAKVASAQENYNTVLAKFKQGTAVQLDVESAKLSLDSEKINLKNAQDNYMVAAEQFEYDLTK
ncbi:TolC family protein [Clostridium sp. LBM24168]